MSDPNYVLRHKETRWFRAHCNFPGPYTELLQQAATFSREEYAARECNYDTESVMALDDVLPFSDEEPYHLPKPGPTPTALEATIRDILWPDGERDHEWDSETFNQIAQAFDNLRPDLVPLAPPDPEGSTNPALFLLGDIKPCQ